MNQSLNETQTNLTPSEYFQQIKDKKQTITDAKLEQMYESCLVLIEKYKKTGQVKGLEKLIFHIETLEKEHLLLKEHGIDTFVMSDDITDFIENVADKAVKIIELKNYEREIPDEIADTVANVKHLFDEMYVVFTDYTGEVERKVEKERRDKDPILFGTFQDIKTGTLVERFYFLGDWEDDYCDLTLGKMVSQMKKKTQKDIQHSIKTPVDVQSLREELSFLETGRKPQPKNETFMDKVKSKFKVVKKGKK